MTHAHSAAAAAAAAEAAAAEAEAAGTTTRAADSPAMAFKMSSAKASVVAFVCERLVAGGLVLGLEGTLRTPVGAEYNPRRSRSPACVSF